MESLFHLIPGHSQEALGQQQQRVHSADGLRGRLGHHQSLAELLRTTTLAEFLEAVEKIEAEDEHLIGKKRKTPISGADTYYETILA